MNASAIQISHATVVVAIEFEKFISTFESLLGNMIPLEQIRFAKIRRSRISCSRPWRADRT
jgi:hypothetical protein